MTKEEMIELAKKHGIEMKKESLKLNASGLDFITGLGADTMGMNWVLRVPRRKDAVTAAEKEKKVLEVIKPRVLMEVPVWIVFHEELIAYPQLTGIPAGTINPETESYEWEIDLENVPDNFHRSLARAMVSLHQIDDIKSFEDTGISIKSPKEVIENMKKRMEKVKEDYEVHAARWDSWQKWLEDKEMWPDFTAPVHGDLHAGHILIDRDAHATGIIDWTEAKITDISTDFTAHYMTFGEAGLDALIQYYEEFGGRTWPRMKEHILMRVSAFPIDVAEFAARSGLQEYKDMAEEQLKSVPSE